MLFIWVSWQLAGSLLNCLCCVVFDRLSALCSNLATATLPLHRQRTFIGLEKGSCCGFFFPVRKRRFQKNVENKSFLEKLIALENVCITVIFSTSFLVAILIFTRVAHLTHQNMYHQKSLRDDIRKLLGSIKSVELCCWLLFKGQNLRICNLTVIENKLGKQIIFSRNVPFS